MVVRSTALSAAIIAFSVGAPISTIAADRTCTAQDEASADAMYEHLGSWPQLLAMYQRFGQCDDGGIAEGNSEAVARMLVDHWEALPQLESLTKGDPGFRNWVLRHIDETLDLEDIRKIEKEAKFNCPQGHSALCRDLQRAAR